MEEAKYFEMRTTDFDIQGKLPGLPPQSLDLLARRLLHPVLPKKTA